jgi:hypothetical protein
LQQAVISRNLLSIRHFETGSHLKQLHFWSRKSYRRAVQLFTSRFYINPHPDVRRSILVAGAARSGTTWLGDLIASQIACRVMFEPFNTDLVPEYHGFNYFQYMRPDEKSPELRSFTEKVLTGKIRNRWIDSQNECILSEFRLIKEIRANLLLKWLHNQFPTLPILFLIRHPCAVVLSRMQLGWATDQDIQPFLSQPNLVADHLSDHLDLIRTARTEEEKHAIIWSVSNLVPLKQFKPGEFHRVFYEDLCTQPEVNLPEIFQTLDTPYDSSLEKKIHQPSQTTRSTSAVVNGADQISQWKTGLNPKQIERVLRVVEAFGLNYLYDDSLLPLKVKQKTTVS